MEKSLELMRFRGWKKEKIKKKIHWTLVFPIYTIIIPSMFLYSSFWYIVDRMHISEKVFSFLGIIYTVVAFTLATLGILHIFLVLPGALLVLGSPLWVLGRRITKMV